MENESRFNVVAVRDHTLMELERKIEQRRQLDKEISGLRVALNGLNATIQAQLSPYELEPPPLDADYKGIREMGLTDAVRRVLQSAPGGMNPKDVRNKLESLHYKLPKRNPLAAIHGIFTRIEKMGEIEPTQPERRDYRWIPEIERLSRVPADYPMMNPDAFKKRLADAMSYERDLTSAEEQQLERILIKVLFQTTMPLSVDDLQTSCVNNGYNDRLTKRTRAFIEATLKNHEHSLKRGKTVKGEDGFIGKDGAIW